MAQDPHGVITLDLQTEGGDSPTHLCVVSQAKSGRLRDRLREFLAPDQEKVVAPGGTEATVWHVKPKAWDGTDASAERQQCSKSPIGDCRPRVELPASLTSANDFYAACTVDTLAEGGAIEDPRPLFLLLEHLDGSPPQVTSIRLTGGVAAIGVDADLDRVVVTARSLGGAYVPHKRSQLGVEEGNDDSAGSGKKNVRVQLGLIPRCRLLELTLPGFVLAETDREQLRVRAHGVEIDVKKCVGPLSGRDVLQVRVPQAPLRVGSIDVELKASIDRPRAQFGGRYTGSWPKEIPYALTFKQVTFLWRRPACIYPEGQCPKATLETGTVCTPTPTSWKDNDGQIVRGCLYRCPDTVDETAIDLVLPQKVKFEKAAPDQTWTDTVARAGQELSSYVDSSEIYLSANVSSWKTDIPDNRITAVEIYGEDGKATKYGIGPLPELGDAESPDNDRTKAKTPRDFRLKVPGASCEPVRFRPIGDRHYEESVAQVRDGKLAFGKPEKAARRFGFNVTLLLGGGPAFSTVNQADVRSGQGVSSGTAPVYFSGLGMFALEIRPRKPRFSRLGPEIRFGGTLGLFASTVPDEDGNAITQKVGWARVLVEPGLVFSVSERFGLGTGFGLGMALPFRSSENLVGNRISFIYSPNIDFRFRVRRWLKLMLQFRGVLNEQPFAQGPGLLASQIAENSWSGSFLTLFGAQVGF